MSEALQRQMIQVCPLRIGQRVTVSPACQFASDWPGEYVITGLRWEYRRGPEVNVTIASDHDIIHRHGDTDGFCVGDLLPIQR